MYIYSDFGLTIFRRPKIILPVDQFSWNFENHGFWYRKFNLQSLIKIYFFHGSRCFCLLLKDPSMYVCIYLLKRVFLVHLPRCCNYSKLPGGIFTRNTCFKNCVNSWWFYTFSFQLQICDIFFNGLCLACNKSAFIVFLLQFLLRLPEKLFQNFS